MIHLEEPYEVLARGFEDPYTYPRPDYSYMLICKDRKYAVLAYYPGKPPDFSMSTSHGPWNTDWVHWFPTSGSVLAELRMSATSHHFTSLVRKVEELYA